MLIGKMALWAVTLLPGFAWAVENADEHLKKLASEENARLQELMLKSAISKSGEVYAKGSALVHDLVLEVPSTLSEGDLKKWHSTTTVQYIASVCELKAQDAYFQRGSYGVRYSIKDQHGKQLLELLINQPLCKQSIKKSPAQGSTSTTP